MLAGITVPSYWRDEAATLAAVQRPFGDMIRMLGNVDAVHGAYYFLAWVIVRLFGSGELALRLPSAIAMAVAAGFVAALGRRIVSPQAGLAAGILFALVPDITLYGTDARSYALVTAMAAVASYVLVRALGAAHGHQRRWWVGYGVSVAVLGILNIFGLLLVAAHAVTMALRMLRPEEGQSRKALAVRWTAVGGRGADRGQPADRARLAPARPAQLAGRPRLHRRDQRDQAHRPADHDAGRGDRVRGRGRGHPVQGPGGPRRPSG